MRILAILGLIGLQFLFAPPARAFHGGGVATCGACHVLHGGEDDPPGGVSGLLRFASATDLCLTCHATANGRVMGGSPTNPLPERGPGSFVFLFSLNLNDAADGLINPIGGHRAGHSVVSLALGLFEDLDHPQAPGGSYPAGALGCTSCHDPHGNSNYRMLRGQGETDAAGYGFVFAAPRGEGPALAGGPEGLANHTAYRAGWSEWCANCHGFYHDEGEAGFAHPVDRPLGGDERQSYNGYDGPDNPTGGDYASAYLPEVPLEQLNMAVDGTAGAFQDCRVTCMTCHRAHASSAPAATRWDPNVAFLDEDGLVSGSYPLPNPYLHPAQRALCVKCHYEESTAHGEGAACLSCHRDRHD